MRIAVKKAVLKDLFVDEPRHRFGQLGGDGALGLQSFVVGDRNPGYEIHREHARCRVVAINLWHTQGSVALELFGKPLGIRGFIFKVELALESFGELMDDSRRVEPGDFRDMLL